MNVRLVQSSRFPNVWSLVDDNGDEYSHTWRDGMFANGAMAAENAVEYAREQGHQIVGIDMVDGELTDPRTGRPVDTSADVIAGIEYRSRRPVLDKFEYVDARGARCHLMQVYGGTASVLYKATGYPDEVPYASLREVDDD